MSAPRKTLPHNHYAVVRVVRQLEKDGKAYFQIERRSKWWPFWRRASTLYDTAEDAIAMAEAYLMVADYLERSVHEAHVVWKG